MENRLNGSGPVHPGSVRLVQLSDCHVSADPGADYRGSNPRQTLDEVLEAAAERRPDLLAVTGDLSEDFSEESYRYLSGRFSSLGVPVLTLPGNHDDPRLQLSVFPACPVEAPLVHDVGEWRLILLNSAVEGEVPGRLSDDMLAGLSTALEDRSRPKLLFLHHQPIPVGSPWIDKYPLREPERLWEVVQERSDVRIVAWGHIHQPFTARRGHIALLGAPSTAVNSLPGRTELTPDPRGPACRWFELASNDEFQTGILGPRWPA